MTFIAGLLTKRMCRIYLVSFYATIVLYLMCTAAGDPNQQFCPKSNHNLWSNGLKFALPNGQYSAAKKSEVQFVGEWYSDLEALVTFRKSKNQYSK